MSVDIPNWIRVGATGVLLYGAVACSRPGPENERAASTPHLPTSPSVVVSEGMIRTDGLNSSPFASNRLPDTVLNVINSPVLERLRVKLVNEGVPQLFLTDWENQSVGLRVRRDLPGLNMRSFVDTSNNENVFGSKKPYEMIQFSRTLTLGDLANGDVWVLGDEIMIPNLERLDQVRRLYGDETPPRSELISFPGYYAAIRYKGEVLTEPPIEPVPPFKVWRWDGPQQVSKVSG